MGLLIFAWGIYTELQNCMYQTAHGPYLSQSLLSKFSKMLFKLVCQNVFGTDYSSPSLVRTPLLQ